MHTWCSSGPLKVLPTVTHCRSQRLKQTYRPLDPQDPAAQLIYVDESALTVSVAGGVGLRVLMDWLAAYKCASFEAHMKVGQKACALE